MTSSLRAEKRAEALETLPPHELIHSAKRSNSANDKLSSRFYQNDLMSHTLKPSSRPVQSRINPDSRKTLWFTVVLIGMLGVTSFMVSFNGLHDVAAWVGLPGWLRWTVPVFIDIAILAYSMAAVIHRARREPVALTWVTLGVFTAISVVANAAHALAIGEGQTPVQSWIGAGIAAAAPIAVFAATEELSRLAFAVDFEESEEGAEEVSSLNVGQVVPVESVKPTQEPYKAPVELETVHEESDVPESVVEAQKPPQSVSVAEEVAPVETVERDIPEIAPDEPKEEEVPEPRPVSVAADEVSDETEVLIGFVREQIASGQKITGAAAARVLDVSDRTGRNRLNALRESHPEVFEGESK